MSTPSTPGPEQSQPQQVPVAQLSPSAGLGVSPAGSHYRSTSIARLGSPIPSGTPPIRQIPTPSQLGTAQSSGTQSPLPGLESSKVPFPSSGPSESALAAALKNSYQDTPPRFGTP